MEPVRFLSSFFKRTPVQLLWAFLFLAFSHNCHATAYTVNANQNDFGGTNILNIGDSLTITGAGNLNTTNATNAVTLNFAGTVSPTNIVNNGTIASTMVTPIVATAGNIQTQNITNAVGAFINGPAVINGHAIDLNDANSTSNAQIVNTGNINGIVRFPSNSTVGGRYTQNVGATLAYALPGGGGGGNTASLLDGNNNPNISLILHGGNIQGRISGFAAIGINGNFATSAGGLNDPSGIVNCTTINANVGTFAVNTPITNNTNFTVEDGATTRFNAGGSLTQSATGSVTLIGTGIFNLNNQSQTIGDLISASNTSSVALGNATLTTGTAAGNTTFAGVISGTGGLTKQSGGTLILSGGNTYTGTTTVNAGTLRMGVANGLAPISALTVAAGGTFDLHGNNQTIGDLSGAGNVILGGAALTFGTATPSTTFSGAIIGPGGLTKQGTGTFVLNGTITNVDAINITAGTFVANNTISGTNTLTGAGTFTLNTAFTASTLSVGNLNVNAGGNLTFINSPAIVNNNLNLTAGTINVSISDVNNFSQLQVGGNTNLNGGTINVALPGNTSVILDQDTFNIISSTGPITVTNLPTLNFPSSLLLSFTEAISGNNLQITAIRKPLEQIDTNPVFNSLSQALDGLRVRSPIESEFSAIVNALDAQTTEAGLDQILAELAPAGINEGILGATVQNLPVLFIEHRLDIYRLGNTVQTAANTFGSKTGYAAGDILEGSSSYGPMIFGNTAKQQTRNGISGYTALTGGFGLLADAPITPYIRGGGAISYAGSSVKQSDATGNLTTISNVQGMLYGSANYGPLFLDGLASLGFNNYRGKRNILFTGQTATANYQGIQYSGKLRGGFTIPFYEVEASPLATVHYTHLNQGRYTEKGAPGANLSVNSLQVSNVQIGLGGSIAAVSQADDFLPEIHVLYTYDTKPSNLQITSQFVDGGAAFVVNGILSPRAGINAGASVTMMMTDVLLVIGSYDFFSKKGYVSNSASLKFKWLF